MNSPIRSSVNSSIVSDQLGKAIHLPEAPLRIVSLVPSQTELLFDLGLEEEVVGITKFCIHPHTWFRSKTRVGGTKKLNIDLIRSLEPNLVIANKEENNPEEVSAIETFCQVWTSDISTIDQALGMMKSLGELTQKRERAMELEGRIRSEFSDLYFPGTYRCAYLIWKDPYMVAGGDTFINDMLKAAGMDNVYQEEKRYPVKNLPELSRENIQILLLSSEPYPFKINNLEDLSKALPNSKIILVDGEMFSWYGSRMKYAPAYFKTLREKLEAEM